MEDGRLQDQSLRDIYQTILDNFVESSNIILDTEKDRTLRANSLMDTIIDIIQNILNIDEKFNNQDPLYVIGSRKGERSFNDSKDVFGNYKTYLRQYTDYIPTNAQSLTVIKSFTENTTLRDKIIKSLIFSYLLENPNVFNLEKLQYEGRYVASLDEAIFSQENLRPRDAIKEEPGIRDLFTNSQLIQDNIIELNKLIERINLELYNNLASGYRFNERRVNERYTTVEDLENDLIRLSSNDTKMISDKFDLIINDFKDGDSANHYETVRNYFKLGIYPLKKVNISDQNKPTKNANLITGTQNVYKVENTQNPLKISSFVNNDLGDYVVNGKKINIKLVGLNYIVKEGTKTKTFKNLSYAKQFIYNGGFDMYNNNKSKFISNMSKDFNNKKPSLKLSYSSNIF
jgi:hypothetical protein